MSIMALSEEEKAFIRDYVAEARDDETASARRGECSELFDVSLPTIRAITAWTTIRANRASAIEKCRVVESIHAKDHCISEPVSDTFPDKQIIRGEHIDYDSEIKSKWRRKMAEFIDQNTEAALRPNMKVLCLPGKNCLEIPLYLELGFLPHNIVGVEGGDAKAKEVFLQNAEGYGIRTFVGDLEDYVSSTEEPFHVVSYDFLGPSCAKYEQIVEATPVAERSLLLLNLMMKRETKRAQYMMQSHSTSIADQLSETLAKSAVDLEKILTEFSLIMRKNLDQETELNPVSELRAGSIATLYSQRLGQRRLDRQAFADRLHVLEFPHVQKVFIRLGAEVEYLVGRHGMKMTDGYLLTGMRGIISAGTHRLSMLCEEKEYKYLSKVGRASSPFHSVFMVLHSPSDDYHRMRKTIGFMLDVAESTLNNPEEKFNAVLFDRRFARKQSGSAIGPKDTIRILNASDTTVASIEVKQLMNDIKAYKVLADTDLKIKMMAGTYTPIIEEIS